MHEPKYELSDASEVEKTTFMKEFGELLAKHSLYFEPVPQFARDSYDQPWKVVTQVLLQKRKEIVKPIPSDNAEVNPALSNETDTKA